MSRASTSVSGLWKCLYSRSCAAVNKSCSRHNFVVFVQKRDLCVEKWCTNMKLPELGDAISRFRLSQSCVGLAGCLCVLYAVWTPFWLKERGLWTGWNDTISDQINHKDIFSAVEAERVFAVLSSLMAVSTSALCLVFALCWTSQTVRSYSNTRALLMAGQALYPTTLLLLTMASTGFFFLLSWSLFTYQHREEISEDFSSLGSSYWLGALGWVLLLVVEMIIFIVEQAIVPDILPDLERDVESWRISSQLKASKCSCRNSYHHGYSRSDMSSQNYMLTP